MLSYDEFELAVRLQSRRQEDREWRRSLGARARRLDAGEPASIAIAASRSLSFASDDEDALTLWKALTGPAGNRTRDLLWRLPGVVYAVRNERLYPSYLPRRAPTAATTRPGPETGRHSVPDRSTTRPSGTPLSPYALPVPAPNPRGADAELLVSELFGNSIRYSGLDLAFLHGCRCCVHLSLEVKYGARCDVLYDLLRVGSPRWLRRAADASIGQLGAR